ncbi:MAG TPA: hypothetical protein VGB82_15005 [Alphaproteobacteria bacterium]
MTMNKQADRDILFQILLDESGRGLTLIQGAPIHTAEDFRRARAELARGEPVAAAPPGKQDRRS